MLSCPWSSLQPATMKFCEENLCSWVTQPANAFSSLIYIILGIFLLFYYKKEKNKALRIIPIVSILIGISSFLYHASFSFFLQVFDLASMFLISSFIIAFNLRRMNYTKRFFLSFIFIFLVQFILLLIIRQKSGAIIFGIAIILSILLELNLAFKSKDIFYKYYLMALLVFVAAFAVWVLDFKQIVCSPTNHLINGHAIWHIISSFSILFLYKFYGQFKF